MNLPHLAQVPPLLGTRTSACIARSESITLSLRCLTIPQRYQPQVESSRRQLWGSDSIGSGIGRLRAPAKMA